MIRRLDSNGDWVFGSGRGAYIGGLAGLALRLETQLREWVGDCFFALQNGINWHLAGKLEQRILREIRNRLMANTEVLGISRIEIEMTNSRQWKPKIWIDTIYEGFILDVSGIYPSPLPPAPPVPPPDNTYQTLLGQGNELLRSQDNTQLIGQTGG